MAEASPQFDAPGDQPEQHAAPPRALTPRALLWALLITLLVAAWTKQAELVALTSQISESTPPIASILVLFLIPGLAGLLNRAARRLEGSHPSLASIARRMTLTHGETLVIFTFVAVTAAMPGVGLFRQVMPCLMVTQYFGQPSDHLEEMARTIPSAWAPTDPEAARVFWEGEDVTPPSYGAEDVPVIGPVLASMVRFLTGPTVVPWGLWRTPVLLWTVYLSAYFIAAFCLVMLFRRAWEYDEHLNFPVASLPVEMIEPERSQFAHIPLFRDPVVWIGFGIAVLYNLMNALHVFNPGIPALGISYPLGNLFTEAPWNAMRGLAIYYKPEILGLGYLVPSDVLLSIWAFTLLSWLVRPVARMAGYSSGNFPFVTEQSMGAFVVLAGYFVFQARGRIAQVVREALTGGVPPGGEPIAPRWIVAGAALGLVVVLGMPIVFGVRWWVALLYFGIMLIVLVVYARNRAEMGFPIVWGYPLYQERKSMVDFLGTDPLVGPGRIQSLTLLTMFSWLQRSVNQAITATGLEATVAAERMQERRRDVVRAFVIAIVVGIVIAFLTNLSAFYEYGGLVLSSPGSVTGGQMTQEVLGQFRNVSEWIEQPRGPNTENIAYTVLGSVLAGGIIVARRIWPRLPFHPGGYALAFTHRSPFMWFPALLLWTIKGITLHLGGAGLYRRTARGFLALTLGHFFSVGIWSLIGLLAGDFVRRYIVWFL